MLTGYCCCCCAAVARLQGVVKALFEHTMLPRVVAGSSVGSIVAGMIATRTDDELRETFRKLDNIELSFFNNSRATELVHSFLQKGALHDMSYLQVCAARFKSCVAAWCWVLCCTSGVAPDVRCGMDAWLLLVLCAVCQHMTYKLAVASHPDRLTSHPACLLSCKLALQRKLKALIGNYTFLEAYERTGRILNVSVCPADTNEPARLLNYLTAPQVGQFFPALVLTPCCGG
jgi:hypothetical protein